MKRTALFLTLAILLLLVPVDPGQAQSGDTAATLDGGYTLPWWTVDGGGTTSSTGEGYTLGGTAGQPDTGVLAGGGYTLAGGFWGGGVAVMHNTYLPLILRGH